MKISVIMPAYNAEKFLAEAIESILNQSYSDFEFIIVDDGSTDGTLAMIQAYAEKDERIQIINGEHKGISAAINLGITAAVGDWLAIMHADDIAMPQRLERQLDYAARYPSVVVWGCNGYRISSKGAIIADMAVGPTSIEACEAMRRKAEIIQAIHPTVLLRRDIVLAVGCYDSRFDGAEDAELFDRMLEHGHLVTIDEKLFKYRIHGSSITMSKISFQKIIVAHLKQRQRERLSNKSLTSFEDFQESYEKRSLWQKWQDWNNSAVTAYYRTAGICLGDGRKLRGIYHLAAAFFINPLYTSKRLYDQVLPILLRRIGR